MVTKVPGTASFISLVIFSMLTIVVVSKADKPTTAWGFSMTASINFSELTSVPRSTTL